MTLRWYPLLVAAVLSAGLVATAHAQIQVEEATTPEVMPRTKSDMPSPEELDLARSREQLRRVVATNPNLELPGSVDPDQYRVEIGRAHV